MLVNVCGLRQVELGGGVAIAELHAALVVVDAQDLDADQGSTAGLLALLLLLLTRGLFLR